MNLRIPITTAAIALATALSLPAQGAGLLFTTLRGGEQTRDVKPQSLRLLDKEDVMLVQPDAVTPPSARKFAPHDAYCALVGDENNDTKFWESPLTLNTDALLWCKDSRGASMRELYISTNEILEGHVNVNTGGGGMPDTARPGDVFRVVIDSVNNDGQFYYLLREEQIRAAFQIGAKEKINVDAITADWKRKMIYISLEEDHTVVVNNAGGPFTLIAKDGAVLGLPVTTWSEPVTMTTAGGLMVLTEAQVDSMVAASLIARHDGNAAVTIGDLDGLNLVAGNRYFKNKWGGFHHLMFCGENLTGGGIVRTGGAIATINGSPMGAIGGPTSGEAVGLRPNNVGSLNGLHIRVRKAISTNVTETPTPELHGAGTVRVDIESFMAGPAFLLLDVATLPIHGMNPALPPFLPGFHADTIWPAPMFLPVVLNGQGIGSWQLAVPATTIKVIFQVAQPTGAGFILTPPPINELYTN